MEKHSPVNPNHIILGTITVLILVIVISGIYRNRRTSTTGADRMLPVQQEHSRMETPPAQAYSNKSRTVKDDEWYRQRILKLVTEISENPVIEEFLSEYSQKSTLRFTSNMTPDQIKSTITTIYEPFTQKIGLSPDKKNSFYDLLTDKKLDILDIESESPYSVNIQDEITYINSSYNAKLRELLSDDEFDAYKEYEENKIEEPSEPNMIMYNYIRMAKSQIPVSPMEKEELLEYFKKSSRGALPETHVQLFEDLISSPEFTGKVYETEQNQEKQE